MIEEHIVSFTEGRIRLRHPALRNVALGAELTAFLQSMNGIDSVTHKAITGSLLIHYDDTIIEEDEITILLEQGEEWLKEHAPHECVRVANQAQSCSEKSLCSLLPSIPQNLTPAQKRKLLNRTMLSAFAVTLLSGGVGNKKAHYIAGGAFALLSLAHIWRMRKAI